MNGRKRWAILELYCGESGKIGFYNSQELGLARALREKEIETTIVYPVKGLKRAELQEVESGITILRQPCRTVGIHAFYDLQFLLDRKIDVVHLDSDNQMYAPAVMRFCGKHGITFYNYVGTIYSDTENRWKRKVMDLISVRNIRYFKKYGVAAKTEAVRQVLEKRGLSCVPVIPVGLDTSQIKKAGENKKELCEKLGIPYDKKRLLFVGRMENYKRPLAALKLLENLDAGYVLIMIGNGSLRGEVEAEIRKMGLEQRVFYRRQIPNIEMYRYYGAADYYINFNTHEIFGMSILEAMYQECTVVARRAPGPEEMIENGCTGFLCDSDEEMRDCIIQRKSDKIGERARQRVESVFTWSRSAEKLIDYAAKRGNVS